MQSCSNTTRPLGTLEPVEGDKTVNEVRAKTIETKETGRKLNVFNKKSLVKAARFACWAAAWCWNTVCGYSNRC